MGGRQAKPGRATVIGGTLHRGSPAVGSSRSDVRGADSNQGKQAPGACAVLLLITPGPPASAARRAAFVPTGLIAGVACERIGYFEESRAGERNSEGRFGGP